MTTDNRLYPHQDPMALGPLYVQHIQAMTAEGLHAKSDIAAQLAYRDAEIARLQAQLADKETELHDTRSAWYGAKAQRDAAQAQVVELADALCRSRNGLLWYQDRFPQAGSQGDDEHMANVNAALAKVGR